MHVELVTPDVAGNSDEFVGLAGSVRAELDVHAEGLASLEEAVATLCKPFLGFDGQMDKVHRKPTEHISPGRTSQVLDGQPSLYQPKAMAEWKMNGAQQA